VRLIAVEVRDDKKGRGVDAADSDGLRDRCCHRKAILHSRLAGNKPLCSTAKDRQCPGVTVEIVKRLLVDIDLTPVLVHLLSHRNNCESVLNTRGLVVDDWVLGVGLNGHASTSPVQGSLAFFYMTLVMYMGAPLYPRSSALSLRQLRNVSAQPTVTTRLTASNAGSPYSE
jgi:hypothetical protein